MSAKPGIRREIIDVLINDLDYNPKTLLESLIASLSDDIALDHLESIARVEDWRHAVTIEGKIIDKEDGKEVLI